MRLAWLRPDHLPLACFGRHMSHAVAIVFSLVMCSSGQGEQANARNGNAERPNVLLIVTDDQGYGDLASHGNPFLETPHLDRLRAESVRLEDYHVDPVCTPTRAAFLTGRYCGRVGAWAVTHGRQLLHRREVTIADVFRESGYRTAMFGKWHLGDPWPYDPNSRGFEEVVCCRAGGVDEIGNPIGNDYFDDIYFRNGTAEQCEGYCTDIFTREAVRFLQASAGNSVTKPFLIYLATNSMHSPFNVPEKYADRFREQGLPENRSRFYGMIENFDENLGKLFEELEESGQAENTIVIFFGDNGTAANSGSEGAFNAGMRGHKGTVYEGGHRVSCFVRWPKGLPRPLNVEQLTSHRDWMPTLIDLCELPSPAGLRYDGQSLAPLLRGDTAGWSERTLFVERQAVTPIDATGEDSTLLERTGSFPHYAVLTERWRLVNGELYDIGTDPSQTRNVADERPEVAADLKQRYRHYFADVYANVQDDARFVVGAPQATETVFTVRDWRPTAGGVIWEPGQLAQDGLTIQGYWPLEIDQAGQFRIEFARFPFEAEQPINACHVEMRVGSTKRSRVLDPSASSVAFETRLAVGRHRLKGTFTQNVTGLKRGPYYVRMTRLGD